MDERTKFRDFSIIVILIQPCIFDLAITILYTCIHVVLNIARIFHSGNRTRIRTRLWRIDSRLHFNFTGGILAKKEMESSSGSFTTDQPEFAPFFPLSCRRRFRNKRKVLSLELAREFLVGCVLFEPRTFLVIYIYCIFLGNMFFFLRLNV